MKKKIVLPALLILIVAAILVFYFVPFTIPGKKGPPKLGSPDFTEALESNVLPPLPPKFGGVIKDTYAESKPWWPSTVVPPKGAPNVLLIMLDDAGYGSAPR
jgi:arylsulfatase